MFISACSSPLSLLLDGERWKQADVPSEIQSLAQQIEAGVCVYQHGIIAPEWDHCTGMGPLHRHGTIAPLHYCSCHCKLTPFLPPTGMAPQPGTVRAPTPESERLENRSLLISLTPRDLRQIVVESGPLHVNCYTIIVTVCVAFVSSGTVLPTTQQVLDSPCTELCRGGVSHKSDTYLCCIICVCMYTSVCIHESSTSLCLPGSCYYC